MTNFNMGTMLEFHECFDTRKGETKDRNVTVFKRRNGDGHPRATNLKIFKKQRELYSKGTKKPRDRSGSRSK